MFYVWCIHVRTSSFFFENFAACYKIFISVIKHIRTMLDNNVHISFHGILYTTYRWRMNNSNNKKERILKQNLFSCSMHISKHIYTYLNIYIYTSRGSISVRVPPFTIEYVTLAWFIAHCLSFRHISLLTDNIQHHSNCWMEHLAFSSCVRSFAFFYFARCCFIVFLRVHI